MSQNPAALLLSDTEKQILSIPVFRSAAGGARDPATTAMFEWVRKGFPQPFNTFENGNRARFIGAEGKLYEWGVKKPTEQQEADVDGAETTHDPTEILFEVVDDDEEKDLSAASIVSTEKETFIVDHQMRLFAYREETGLRRCLADHCVSQVACGANHVLVLTIDGQVHSAGDDSFYQLGHGKGTSTELTALEAIKMPNQQAFPTYVGCGHSFSIILCNNNHVYCVGGFAGSVWCDSLYRVVAPEDAGSCVKVTCGKDHALFLTAERRLAGLGVGSSGQLGTLASVQPSSQSSLREVPWNEENGHAVDVFCHPRFNISVVLSSNDDFYVCGEAGELVGHDSLIKDFHCLRKHDAVILQGTVVCMKPPMGRRRAEGFNDPCNRIQLVPAQNASPQQPTKERASECLRRLPIESLRRLCNVALDRSTLSPQDVVKEFQDRPAQNGHAASSSRPATAVANELGVFLGEETVRRSKCLMSQLVGSQNGDEDEGGSGTGSEGRKQKKRRISIPDREQKFSNTTLMNYVHFLYMDAITSELRADLRAPAAIDLLELAREIKDDLGLAAQSAWHAKHHISPDELPACLRKCIDSRYFALGIELVKLLLCLENCCDVLQVAEIGPPNNKHAEYIRDISMAFAAANATAVVQSQGYQNLDDHVSKKLLKKLATAACLNT